MEKEAFKAEVKTVSGRVFDFIRKNPKTTVAIAVVVVALALFAS